LNDVPMLLVTQSCALARGAAGHDGIRAIRDLKFDELFQRRVVHAAIAERGYERNDRSTEHGPISQSGFLIAWPARSPRPTTRSNIISSGGWAGGAGRPGLKNAPSAFLSTNKTRSI